MCLLGRLEVGSAWPFDALHVRGIDYSIADGISPWESEAFDDNLRAPQPDVAWHRRVWGPAGVEL